MHRCGNRIFHDLRRTCISDMIDAGVPQSTCMFISGHTVRLGLDSLHFCGWHRMTRQLIDALAGPHALYGHSLNFREYRFLLSTRLSSPESLPIVCQFKGSFHFCPPGCDGETRP